MSNDVVNCLLQLLIHNFNPISESHPYDHLLYVLRVAKTSANAFSIMHFIWLLFLMCKSGKFFFHKINFKDLFHTIQGFF